MSPDEQPTILTSPPNGSRPSPLVGWQAPSVEEMQALLPQYEIMEILGRGGMGAVYKGRQKSLKRLVAIKILPLGMADDEMKFAERFQNEAQTMAAMNHPAIVAVHDFGETANGLLYFIMEYVDGSDVQKMIQASGRLSGEHVLAITAHVCDALSYAHKRGVIHRDIKPANILIDQEGHIKVADFGLAKMDDPSQTSGLTKSNMAMGTPDYVAPEVLSPGKVADHRADLYAVGVMLYQMLTGEVPRGLFKLPSRKGVGSDPRFDEIICKAMEQDRDERYQSAGDLRRALDVILTTPQPKDDGTGVVKAIDIPQKPVAKGPRPSGERSQASAHKPAPQQAPKKGSPATMWLSIGGILAVLGLAGFLVLGGKPKPEARTTTDTAPATSSFANPKASASSSPAKEMDLLALVDVKRDALAGEWSHDGGDLLVKATKPDAKGTPRLQLPYQPPEEYDFEIEFTPESGTNMVGQALSAYQRSFSWFLDAQTNAGSKAGFDGLDGTAVSSRTKGTIMRAKFLTNGQRHRSTIEVRRSGLRTLLDGELLVKWGSAPSFYERLEISKNEKLRDALHLGLAAHDRSVRFHKITVREIAGTGKVDAGVLSAHFSPNGKTIDLLPLVDFIRAVAAASPEEQVSLVTARLNEINGAQATLVPTIVGGKVKFLRVERKGDALLLDISPLAALKDLTDLRLMYVGPADISCLGGLRLERLEFHGGTFEDISVLKSMPLRFLGLSSLSPNSQEALDFTILRGMKLEMLKLSSKHLVDISFIKGMPLRDLILTDSSVRDFSPIAGMPLSNLEFDPEAKPDMALLRSIPTLKTINKRPAAEYLK